MSCSPFDLKDYFLKELAGPHRSQVEAHLKTCAACREELERLRLTETALFTLRDEEIPQRIAFFSDKIFEPSALSRWWGAFWGSAARLGFASAAMLSAALIFYSLRPVPVRQIAAAPPPAAQVVRPASLSDAQIQARIDTAVAKAVAQSEARQTQNTQALVAELERTRQRLLIAAGEFDYYQKKANQLVISANNYSMPPLGNPEVK